MNRSLTYRVAILVPDAQRVLVERRGGRATLPRVSVRKGMRAVRQIQMALWSRWGLRAVVLDFVCDTRDTPLFIAESLRARATTLTGVSLDQVGEADLADLERRIILEIYAGDTGPRGPFSRIGWHTDAIAWIENETRSAARLTGEIEQYSAGGGFALARLPRCDGSGYWIKAVGFPNLHEYEITSRLVQSCAKYMPRVIAARSDWHAWVMEDGGSPSDLDAEIEPLLTAAGTMAELQLAASHHTQELLDAGAADHRAESAVAHIEPLIRYLNTAMERQISTRAPRVDSLRLFEIQRLLVEAYKVVATLQIPDTIIHNDLNRGNFLIRGGGCVFIDWCESAIGFPFMMIQHLATLIPITYQGTDSLVCKIKSLYRQVWARQLEGVNFTRALALAPPMAIASRLYGRGDWLESTYAEDPAIQAYTRTVARRLDRAARAPAFVEALCR